MTGYRKIAMKDMSTISPLGGETGYLTDGAESGRYCVNAPDFTTGFHEALL